MSNFPVYRLYIAEYEQSGAWMNGGGSGIVKYLKPYDMYLVYRTGRSRLPSDSYKRILDNMGEQCKFIDATQMSDADLHNHMLAQIEYYANEHTHIYFLCDKEDYQALRDQIKVGVELSLKTGYRTGAIDIPPDADVDFSKNGKREMNADTESVPEITKETRNEIKPPKADEQFKTSSDRPSAKQKDEAPLQPNETKQNFPKEEKLSGDKTEKPASGEIKDEKATDHQKQDSGKQNNKDGNRKPKPRVKEQGDKTEKNKKQNDSKEQENAFTDGPMSMFAAMFEGKIGDASQRAPGSKPPSVEQPKKLTKEEKIQKQEQAKEKWVGKASNAVPSSDLPKDTDKTQEQDIEKQADEGIVKPQGEKQHNANNSIESKEKNSCGSECELADTQENITIADEQEDEPAVSAQEISDNTDETSTFSDKNQKDDEEPKESKKPWTERISADEKQKESGKASSSKLQDLERSIFGAKQASVTIEKHYSALDDSKAKTVSLLADRMIEDIEFLIKDIKKHSLSYDAYMELISTLIRSDNLEDFKEGWSIVHPGCELTLDKATYKSLYQEACHYARTCEVLYAEDNWS